MTRYLALAGVIVVGAFFALPSRDPAAGSAITPAPVTVHPRRDPQVRAMPPRESEPSPALAAILGDARTHLIGAARTCWTPRANVSSAALPDETIGALEYRYQLVTDGAEAHVERLTIKSSTVRDPALRDCFARELASARWSSTAAAASVPVRDTLRIGELTRHDAPGPDRS